MLKDKSYTGVSFDLGLTNTNETKILTNQDDDNYSNPIDYISDVQKIKLNDVEIWKISDDNYKHR